jgi:hypothetical protein
MNFYLAIAAPHDEIRRIAVLLSIWGSELESFGLTAIVGDVWIAIQTQEQSSLGPGLKLDETPCLVGDDPSDVLACGADLPDIAGRGVTLELHFLPPGMDENTSRAPVVIN